jgi:DNA-binding ferritin-like protein (Dps family)
MTPILGEMEVFRVETQRSTGGPAVSGLVAYIKRLAREKREFNHMYQHMQERAKALPEDYHYVYYKIQHYLWWSSSGGDDGDLMPIFADLLDLFETVAAEGKSVLDITGKDALAFCNELLRNAKVATGNRREVLSATFGNTSERGMVRK